MNGWERFITNPAWGASIGIGEIIADTPMRLRTGPGLHADVYALLQRGVTMYVFDPVPANDPPGEWLPVMLCQDAAINGWVHSEGVVRIFPHEDVAAAEKLRVAAAANRAGY